MPYIGNEVGNRFVASKAASVYSGDGSTTAFTLEHAVGSDEDILVSVDGVIQEPSVAYAVSSGTTLTFTAAPSTNSGNNIFVYYLFRTVATVDHSATSALSATSGTFSTDLTVDTNTLIVDSTNNSVGIGASPDSNRDLHIKRTGANASILIEETSATNYGQFIELKDSATSWFLANRYAATGTGQSGFGIGTTNSGDMLQIDTNGAVIMPLQPAFCVTPSSQQDNITADNNNQTIAFGSERFDQNSDFASNTFTAPVTGKYLLSMQLRFENGDTASGYHLWSIATSNKTYQGIRTISGLSADPAYLDFGLTVVADMDANDTAIVQVLIETGAAQSDIDPDSYFSGYLVA